MNDIEQLRTAVHHALAQPEKHIPARFAYDFNGMSLWGEITQHQDYYLTRTEISILENCVADLQQGLGQDPVALIYFGGATGRKVEILLDHLSNIQLYVPIDIAGENLRQTTVELSNRYPHLDIQPLEADFEQVQTLSLSPCNCPRVFCFAVSTIGQMTRQEAVQFLTDVAGLLGEGGKLIVGVDRLKDPEMLERAYRQPCAKMAHNHLGRIERDLGAQIDMSAFIFTPQFDPVESAVIFYMTNTRKQVCVLDGIEYPIKQDEKLRLGMSRKYSEEDFHQVAETSGWCVQNLWTDCNRFFNLYLLELDNSSI